MAPAISTLPTPRITSCGGLLRRAQSRPSPAMAPKALRATALPPLRRSSIPRWAWRSTHPATSTSRIASTTVSAWSRPQAESSRPSPAPAQPDTLATPARPPQPRLPIRPGSPSTPAAISTSPTPRTMSYVKSPAAPSPLSPATAPRATQAMAAHPPARSSIRRSDSPLTQPATSTSPTATTRWYAVSPAAPSPPSPATTPTASQAMAAHPPPLHSPGPAAWRSTASATCSLPTATTTASAR